MYKQTNKISWQFLLFSCLALYLVNLQVIPVDIMEARNFISAREMITDGSWFHTTLNGLPRYEKPPLPTWITAGFGSVFGFKVWALRLPAALMALCSFYYLSKIATAIPLKTEVAKLSVYVAATSFYILFSGKNGQWDIYTHGFAIIGLYYLFESLNKKKKNLKNSILAGVLFGCSILSKGPVAIYALVLPFLITYIAVYRKTSPKANWKYLGLTAVLSLIVGTSWYVGVYLSNPDKVLAAMAKESGNWTSYNVRPFYYYWSFFIQTGVWSLTALLAILIPIFKKFKWEDPNQKFSYLWTVCSLVLLSLIPEKKSRYLLPVLFPLAITIGVSIYNMYVYREDKELWNRINRGVLKFMPLFISLALALGGLYFLIFEAWSWLSLNLIFLISSSLLVFRLVQKTESSIYSLVYAYSLLSISIVCFGLPYAFKSFTNPSYKSTSELHTYESSLGISTYAMSNPTPEFVWDYGSKIKIWDADSYQLPEAIGMLVSNADLELFLSSFEGKQIEHLARFDRNQSAEGSKNHRERLYIDYYLVKDYSN